MVRKYVWDAIYTFLENVLDSHRGKKDTCRDAKKHSFGDAVEIESDVLARHARYIATPPREKRAPILIRPGRFWARAFPDRFNYALWCSSVGCANTRSGGRARGGGWTENKKENANNSRGL